MSIPESIMIALFVMAVVFAVLGILWSIIKVFTTIVQRIEHRAVVNGKK
ncbi:MAG: hypothetical protein K0R00_3316 [Herbinix sp.]|jgi:Na+-transporting methylmalonyl-CoA/oxaloacetate decarboxylase gamma subunit|nr:hypothetical protein [Herbinix sp.]